MNWDTIVCGKFIIVVLRGVVMLELVRRDVVIVDCGRYIIISCIEKQIHWLNYNGCKDLLDYFMASILDGTTDCPAN